MKKYLPYIIGVIALIALAALLVGSVKKPQRVLNNRITLKHQDKIPYGFYAARALLPSIFPDAKIYTDKNRPGYWDSLIITGSNQAVFLIGDFNASEDELNDMMDFVRNGNHVFIVSKTISYDARRFFGFEEDDISSDESYYEISRDSLRLTLSAPRFNDTTTYIYPGRNFSNSFDFPYSDKIITLGKNEQGAPDFLQLKAEFGSVYLHTAPLAFSNYFILHKNNVRYFQQAISVIPAGVKKILWNEYYIFKKSEPQESEPNWLSVLFKYEAFRWAFLTALATLLLYVLLEMRRKQRIIPIIQKPKNDSLDFVQTIGRLYYDQKDHKDLAQKMGAYFLDHVRNRYKISTNDLDESFVNALHAKSGYPVDKVTALVNFIDRANGDPNISEQQLAHFHKELENFYQHT